jgi:hypothetical protein
MILRRSFLVGGRDFVIDLFRVVAALFVLLSVPVDLWAAQLVGSGVGSSKSAVGSLAAAKQQGVASGATQDASQKGQFSSDSAQCKQTKDNNVCNYVGHAKFFSDVEQLSAPVIAVYRDLNNQIQQILAQGNAREGQAHYYRKGAGCFRASKESECFDSLLSKGNKINIYPVKKLVVWEEDAEIIRARDRISAYRIEYNTDKKTILAIPEKNAKTQITLYPVEEKKDE